MILKTKLNTQFPNIMKKLFYLFLVLFTSLKVQAQKPTITNFSPTSGVVGTTVTITGTNFNATTSQNVVFFGASKATVTAASTTSLTVTVPTGATFQPITVLTGTYTLKWYKASDNSLVTMPVSPTTTTNYYAKCENTASATTCLSPASANVVVYVGNIINSLITGDWENTNTWTPSRIPLPTDNVIINNHTVTITSNSANTKKVDLKGGGGLRYLNAAGKMNVGF
jgi:hypothetical protein